MPSKGISVYSYVSPKLAPLGTFTVEFTIPGPNGTLQNTAADNFSVKQLEMESHLIPGVRNFTGQFSWRVLRDGSEIASAWNKINTLTGNLAGGDMLSTQHFTPITAEDVIITYGFYDAGHGDAGLTNRDQCYVTVCPRANADWMGHLAPPGSPAASLPFSRFVLPAPHDNGMNSMQHPDAVLAGLNASHIPGLKELLPHLNFFSHLPDSALVHLLPNIVYGVSVTQKKEIETMLELGARYFEFRPAKLIPTFQELSNLENKFYFQHACIPGIAFDHFLEDQVAFLDAHPNEIVTIHIRFDNIVKECVKPTNEEISDLLNQACSKATRGPLKWGGRECFSTSIEELRSTGTRIIVVILAEKYDSWTAEAYATLHTDSIIARFEGMNTQGQESTDITVLQCQATSQSIKEVLVYSVLTANAATSCLTSTKASGDMVTLPWLRNNLNKNLTAEKTVVVMNDFIDGATCDTCIELSRERLAKG